MSALWKIQNGSQFGKPSIFLKKIRKIKWEFWIKPPKGVSDGFLVYSLQAIEELNQVPLELFEGFSNALKLYRGFHEE